MSQTFLQFSTPITSKSPPLKWQRLVLQVFYDYFALSKIFSPIYAARLANYFARLASLYMLQDSRTTFQMFARIAPLYICCKTRELLKSSSRVLQHIIYDFFTILRTSSQVLQHIIYDFFTILRTSQRVLQHITKPEVRKICQPVLSRWCAIDK